MTLKKILATASVVTIATSSILLGTSSLAQGKTNITIWSWSDQSTFIQQFEKRHSDIHVKFVQIPFPTYERKIMTIMRSPKNGPDMFTSHSSYIQRFVKYKLYKPLTEFNKYRKDIMPYIWKLGADKNGSLYAASYQSTPGAFIYNRDFAKKVFGTDDPKAIDAHFDTWDHMFESIDKVNKVMGRKMKFLDNTATLMGMTQAKYKEPLVTDGNVLNTGPMMHFAFNLFLKFNKRNSILEQSDDNYIAKSISDKDVFGMMAPAWFLKNKIAHLAPQTIGHWGVVTGPNAYFRGGLFYGINKALTDPARLKASKLFIEEMNLKEDTSTEYVIAKNDFPSNYKVLKNLANTTSDVLKGQKYIPIMSQKAGDIYANPTDYDDVLLSLLEDTNAYLRNHPNMTVDDLLAKYKKDAKLHLPRLKIK